MAPRVVVYQIREHDNTVTIEDSTGCKITSSSLDQLLGFLRYRQSGVLRATWDLDDFVAPLLKLMPLNILKPLSEFNEHLGYNNHEMYYLPERMFRVGRARFYGLKQLYSTDEPEPTTIQETQDKADKIITDLEAIGLSPTKLTSPIAIFEDSEYGQQIYDSIPKGYDLPEASWEALQYAYQAGRREWITAYQLGHWEAGDIFDYDIRAAYASQASGLLDISTSRIYKDTDYFTIQPPLYGLVRGKLWLDPDAVYQHTSPIIADLDRLPGNPAGNIGDDYYMTLDEALHIQKNHLGTFTLKDGWFIDPPEVISHPFAPIMSQLYNHRSVTAPIAKGIANQLIGKLIETRVDGTYGPLRNDIYHTLIQAGTRLKVSQFLIDNQIAKDELVAVQTDGCRLTRYVRTTDSFGNWRLNGSSPTIVVSPYKVYTEDKKPGHITYQSLASMIADHPRVAYYGTNATQRITLKQALQLKDLSQVGKTQQLPAHVDLNTIAIEQNRRYTKLPHSGESLMNNKFTSSPVILR